MSKLDDILDSGLFVDEEGQPDYRTGKVRLEIKELILGLINDPEIAYIVNEVLYIDEKQLRQKVEEL